jgi:transcriptional regulator with XRE-family HTH domain
MGTRKPKRNLPLISALATSKLPQYRIAQRADLDPTLLSAYASGRRQPPKTHRQKIAKVLHKRIADLFQPEDPA